MIISYFLSEIALAVYKKVSFVAPGIKSMSVPSSENTQVKGNDKGQSHFIYHSLKRY